jgi:hypothetical protein
VFLERGGIDWKWLESRWNDFSHPDYPLLVPLNYAFPGVLQGSWNDRWIGLVSVPWAIAVLLVVRTLTAEEAPNWVSAAATFASTPVAMSRYVGLAEGALIAFAGAALLFLRRAFVKDDALDWRHGALLLGLAANCKNEGMALIVAVAAGVVLADRHRWRRALRLWPAIALAGPWLLMRATHALPTDIVSGNILDRLQQHLSDPGSIFLALDQLLFDRWTWIAILATLLIVPSAISRERFILIASAVQIAIYVAAYFVTPIELTWHVATSWDRLTRQLQLPVTAISVMLLAQVAASNDPGMRRAMS